MRRAANLVPALALMVSGCTYYNAMWSAERFAKDARRLEAHGREPEARGQWARAAAKAESVLVHHPRSRWADDALVLKGEGLALAGTCSAAAAPIAHALATVTDPPLRERAGLAAAQCALATGKPSDAEHVLTEALASSDPRRRSRAEYLAGQGAAGRLDYDSALAHFRRSQEPAALPARARVLLAAARPVEAAAVLDTLTGIRFREAEWTELLDGLAIAGGVDAASAALDRMLARARVPSPERARLLIADGDRRFAAADLDAAAARYRQAVAAPSRGGGGGGGGGGPVGGAETGGEARTASVREQRVLAARAAGPGDLSPIVTELTRISGSGPGGGGPSEAQALLNLVARVAATPTSPGGAFRSAELARDSLAAPRLAARLFLDLATTDSASLFAPKALVAAMALLPDRRDSIVGVLDRTYAASPYTRALRGDASPAYAALEDSLAHELGVELARVAPGGAARVRASGLLTGPRGPWLDDAPSRGGGPPTGVRRLPPQPGEPGRRVPTERPRRERPVVPPAAS